MEELPFDRFAFTPVSAWGRCLLHFMQSLESRETQFVYANLLTQWLAGQYPDGAARSPDRYTRADVESFIHAPLKFPNARVGQAPAASTIGHRLAILSSFYRYASRYLIEHPDGTLSPVLSSAAPTTGIKTPRKPRRLRAFTLDELRVFFASIPRDTPHGLRDRALFLCYFWTARRRAEILRLRYCDIDYGTLIDDEGKPHDGWRYRFYSKGHFQQEEWLELPGPAIAAINLYLAALERPALCQYAKEQRQECIFIALGPPNIRNLPRYPVDRPMSGGNLSRLVNLYVRRAGLNLAGEKHLTAHSFRHTAAQVRFRNGQTLESLSRFLGHAHKSTTDDYLNFLLGNADPIAEKLLPDYGNL